MLAEGVRIASILEGMLREVSKYDATIKTSADRHLLMPLFIEHHHPVEVLVGVGLDMIHYLATTRISPLDRFNFTHLSAAQQRSNDASLIDIDIWGLVWTSR